MLFNCTEVNGLLVAVVVRNIFVVPLRRRGHWEEEQNQSQSAPAFLDQATKQDTMAAAGVAMQRETMTRKSLQRCRYR